MQRFIPAIAFIVIFSSCADDSKNNLAVFRALEEGLQQSNKIISQSNEAIYHSLKERSADPGASEYTTIWLPKAMMVKYLSDSIVRYIRELKEELKNEAGPDEPGDKGSSQEGNLTVTDHVFESHGRGKELFEKLLKYRQEVLSVDSGLNEVFGNNIIVFTGNFDYTRNDTAAFIKTYFNNIPLIATYAMLSKFENNVKIIENNFTTFCHNKTFSVMIIDDFPEPLISQSKSYVKAGEEIEITAGIGSFSDAPNPTITINNKVVPLNDRPIAIYKLKALVKSGKHYVPVMIEFFKPDGTKTIMQKSITYTVIE